MSKLLDKLMRHHPVSRDGSQSIFWSAPCGAGGLKQTANAKIDKEFCGDIGKAASHIYEKHLNELRTQFHNADPDDECEVLCVKDDGTEILLEGEESILE